MSEKTLALSECTTLEDLDRLDPREYARLISTPATQLDLVRMEIQLRRAHDALVEAFGDVVAGVNKTLGKRTV